MSNNIFEYIITMNLMDNSYIVLLLAALILWFCWRMTVEGFEGPREHFGNGAMGPYSISTAAQAFATRPGLESGNDRLQFRSLNDMHNW